MFLLLCKYFFKKPPTFSIYTPADIAFTQAAGLVAIIEYNERGNQLTRRSYTITQQKYSIVPSQLIITCEACHESVHFLSDDEDEMVRLFGSYKCPNGCNRTNYSYISIGEIALPARPPSFAQNRVDRISKT
jgi:hypothetical protein